MGPAGGRPDGGARDLYRRAMAIGRDHIASTVDTLVLAYAGASLPLLLLFTLASRPIADVVTGSLVAEEIVRTLVGGIGLVASVPVTTGLAALVATRCGPAPGAAGCRCGPQAAAIVTVSACRSLTSGTISSGRASAPGRRRLIQLLTCELLPRRPTARTGRTAAARPDRSHGVRPRSPPRSPVRAPGRRPSDRASGRRRR